MPGLSLEEALNLFAQEKYEQCMEAIECYAEEGNAAAAANLGLAFQLGLGVPVDFDKAVLYLTLAATQGSGEAAHNLGTLYATMPENRSNDKARNWFNKARRLGFDPSTEGSEK